MSESVIKIDRKLCEGTRQFLLNARPTTAKQLEKYSHYLPAEKAFELPLKPVLVRGILNALKKHYQKHGELVGYDGALTRHISFWSKLHRRMQS